MNGLVIVLAIIIEEISTILYKTRRKVRQANKSCLV